jgi:ACS family tartrate transporter-like MFS transporter
MTITTNSDVARSAVEIKTVRKLRRRLVPFLFTIFVIAFIDRTNIGFAALTMNKELAIASEQFGLLSGIFFIGYFLFEVPSNLLLHKIGARIWIARILITWGLIATLTGFVQNVHQLYFMRFLLGLAEAGYFPGIVLYLTYWFRQRDLAQTTALFMAGLPVTSIVGGPLSGLIMDHVHWLGLSNWRWLLILEGLPAVVFGVITYWALPNRPEDARFLDPDEKDWLLSQLKEEEQKKLDRGHCSAIDAAKNPRVWHLTVTYFGVTIGAYALNFWAPQVIRLSAGQSSNVEVGISLMIINLLGLSVMFFVSRSSDRKLERRWHVAIPLTVGGTALLLLGMPHSAVLSVAFLSLLAIGVYSALGPFWALPNEFLAGYSAAVGIALINSIGNLGGFVGPYTIGAVSRVTGSIYYGLALSGGALLVSAMLVLLLRKKPLTDTP